MEKKRLMRKVLLACANCLALSSLFAASLALPTVVTAATPNTTALPNSIAPWTAHATQTGLHKANDQLTIGVILKTSHPDEQKALLKDLYNPKSVQYHHWLQAGAFAARFAPAAADIAAAKSFIATAGLKLSPESDNTLLLATGTTSQVATAFHTQINDYRLANSEVHYANSSSIQLPSSLSAAVTGVIGLSDLVQLTPAVVKPTDTKPGYAYGGGVNGSGLTPSQTAGIYNAQTVYSKLHDTGKGVTLALYELSGYKKADIATYEKAYHLPNIPVVDKPVLGGPIAITGSKDYGASEVELDIQLQIGAAPGARQVLVYNAPNTEVGTLAEYAKMVKDNQADVISSSWANACEYSQNSQVTQAENQYLLQGATQGQSFFVASGDAGAYGCSRVGITPPADQALQIGDPSNQPYITSVGGTSFRTQGGGAILFNPAQNAHPTYPGTKSETVWNRACSPTDQAGCGAGGAGGGGVSRIWGESDYAFDYTNTGAPLPGVQEAGYSQTGAYCGQQPGVLCRQSPDVSLDADPNTGYSFYCSDKGDSFCVTGDLGKPGWSLIGGTSCSSPVWSGFVGLDVARKGRLGLFNYIAYPYDSPAGYAKQFHDITIGDNGYYPAGANYDLATGIGTPNVYELVNAK